MIRQGDAWIEQPNERVAQWALDGDAQVVDSPAVARARLRTCLVFGKPCNIASIWQKFSDDASVALEAAFLFSSKKQVPPKEVLPLLLK